MLELMNYRGCGNCHQCNDDRSYKDQAVPVKIKFLKEQKWDNWGRFVTAFKAGDEVEGEAVVIDNKVYCASATSPYWDVSDSINLMDVEITIV